VTPGEQNIFRLDVAVNDAVLVRVIESVCNFSRDQYRLIDGKLMLALELIAESFAVDERHREPHSSGSDSGIEYAEYVGMLEASGELDLPVESLGAYCFGYVRVEDFQRDMSVVPEIISEIHRRESALAELTLYRVPTSQGFFEWLPVAQWSHGGDSIA
jgi:hypothetical protein